MCTAQSHASRWHLLFLCSALLCHTSVQVPLHTHPCHICFTTLVYRAKCITVKMPAHLCYIIVQCCANTPLSHLVGCRLCFFTLFFCTTPHYCACCHTPCMHSVNAHPCTIWSCTLLHTLSLCSPACLPQVLWKALKHSNNGVICSFARESTKGLDCSTCTGSHMCLGGTDGEQEMFSGDRIPIMEVTSVLCTKCLQTWHTSTECAAKPDDRCTSVRGTTCVSQPSTQAPSWHNITPALD